MIPPRKNKILTKEEILQKKREAAKTRLIKIKSDPIKLAEYKDKKKIEVGT